VLGPHGDGREADVSVSVEGSGLCGRVLVKATKVLPAAGLGGLTGDRDW